MHNANECNARSCVYKALLFVFHANSVVSVSECICIDASVYNDMSESM